MINSTSSDIFTTIESMSEDEIRKRFNKALNHYFGREGLSQSELAEKIGVTQTTISRYLYNKCAPDFRIALKIANHYRLNLYEFIELPVPNVISDERLFRQFIKELHALICKYIRPKNGSIGLAEQSSNNHEAKLRVSYEYYVTGMYPYANECSGRDKYTICDDYLIVNGNIYPEQHIDMVRSYENEHIPFFDYVNSIFDHEGNTSCFDERYKCLKSMMNAYVHNKHLFGVLGTLTASKFYWLVYLLGYGSKFTTSLT